MDYMPGMDMGGVSSDPTIGTMGMTLGFHLMPFDQLFFARWTPETNGAMVGACVGLFMLAVVDRWLAGVRALCERGWARRSSVFPRSKSVAELRAGTDSQRSSAFLTARRAEKSSAPAASKTDVSDTESELEDDCCLPSRSSSPHATALPLPSPLPSLRELNPLHALRALPMFFWSEALPRGLLHLTQAALGYALMLAFMTYSWGYALSILAGLGVGEMLFGRFGGGAGGAHHAE